jgi:hypothetical protein
MIAVLSFEMVIQVLDFVAHQRPLILSLGISQFDSNWRISAH